ncbi:TolC family protein [Roseiconus lacunae]|uniref:TolC family protein n=1 Tax=Roseiconus lacunae TaxID=2605694 RepID=UPI001E4750A0|nr:TolC family protein [Roseiconus lacunae]MCD0458681.1 TolC family protein [Roseiconus lacunae]
MVLSSDPQAAAETPNTDAALMGMAAEDCLKYAVVDEVATADEPTSTQHFSLIDCIHFTLANNQVIRRDAELTVIDSPLLAAPQSIATTLDPSIQDSGFLFGQRGPAAALSDFDTRLNIRTIWGRDETIRNNLFLSGGIPPGKALVADSAFNVVELVKQHRSGGQSRLFQTAEYSSSNRQDLLFGSAYRLTLGAEFRQPLLAGAGTRYTDVAGATRTSLAGVTGVSQGILIARSRTQVAKLELEQAVSRLILEIEILFSEILAAEQALAVVSEAIASLQQSAELMRARIDAAAGGNELDQIAVDQLVLRAEEIQLQTQSRSRAANQRLRRLMSLSLDAAIEFDQTESCPQAEVKIDCESVAACAIDDRSEIKQQRQRIQEIELQIRAAQSLLLPQLDGIARYRINGFGDSLDGSGDDLQGAYGNLFDNQHTGWELGFEFSHPFGRRYERTRIRDLRLKAQKEKILLREQVDEIYREISAIASKLEATYDQQDIIRQRTELTNRRASVLSSQYQAGESVAPLQLAEADFAVTLLRLSAIDLEAEYRQWLARLKAAAGANLRENGLHVVY